MLPTKTVPIKEVREKYRLTQEQLAKVLGTSWVTISRWERGTGNTSEDAEAKLHRMDSLLRHIDTLIAPEDLARFLMTPNSAMDGFPPMDLLQSGYAFRKLVELVEKAKSGEYS